MARIPDEEIARIKQEVSLVRLVESSGITLKKQGKDYFGHCPFHNDKTPSLSITPSKNEWHCFGACGEGGDVIRWVEKMHGISFTKAFHMLKEQSPGLSTGKATVKNSTVPKLENPFKLNTDDQVLLNQVIGYYHESLKQNPEALAYLEKRGLNNPDMLTHFKLGFANRTLGYRLPKANRKTGAQIRGQLQKIGLLRDSGHEHFNGSIVFPIINHQQVQEVYGRKIRDDLRKGTPVHCYLPGPHKGVFNLAALVASKEIILAESIIDALTFWCAGYKNVTTSYGINGFTDELLQSFKQHKTERVLIAYDRDEAGNKAASDLADRLVKEGIDCYRINFPKNMDANEYALQVQPATKSLGLVIRKAHWLGKGKQPDIKTQIQTLDNGLQVDTGTGEILSEQDTTVAKKETETKNEHSSLAAIPDTTQASPLPDLPKADIDAECSDHEIKLHFENRLYRVRGLTKNLSYEQLKINLMIRVDMHMHVDELNFYNWKQRQSFIKQASIELGLDEVVLKTDLSQLLLKLESLQEQNIKKELAPKDDKNKSLTNEEYESALNLLKDKNLLRRILDDFNTCGVVGEHTNKLMGYLSCVSRKLNKPLAIMIQSTSAAGKTALMDAILDFIPEEERIQYSAMTGQSLFYMGETDLEHKILAISEEEGAENASYALKLLQSEGEVSIASTGKDETTGNMVTKTYKVKGPVMLFLTTTAIDLDEELLNRCLSLTVDESREQTKAIHALQRKEKTLEGLKLKARKKRLVNLHQNAQRLIRSLAVVNHYAEQLTFMDDKTRTRRDHMKYLQLIESIALLHQYQRQVKPAEPENDIETDYIEVEISDIEVANKIANEVLGRTLDELPPQTRNLLQLINKMVVQACKKEKLKKNDVHFSRKTIRDFTGWGNTQLKIHLNRLEDMEYLLIHRGQRGQTIIYELLYSGEGQDGKIFLCGLIDTKTLKKHTYDKKKSGVNTEKSGSSRPQVGGVSAPSRGNKINGNPINTVLNEKTDENPLDKVILDKNKTPGRNPTCMTEG